MLESKIKLLITHIKDKIPVFGDNGFYWDKLKEPASGMTGVTDTKDIYFGIQLKPRSTPDDFIFVDTSEIDHYKVLAQYQFVASVGCVNKMQAIQTFINALSSYPGLNIKILSASFNSSLIYRTLYGQEYSNNKANLVLIEFSVSDMFIATNCFDLDFCEDCCARTEETCWCGCFTN